MREHLKKEQEKERERERTLRPRLPHRRHHHHHHLTRTRRPRLRAIVVVAAVAVAAVAVAVAAKAKTDDDESGRVRSEDRRKSLCAGRVVMSSLARITVVIVSARSTIFVLLLNMFKATENVPHIFVRAERHSREKGVGAACEHHHAVKAGKEEDENVVAAFDDDESDEHEKNDARDDADDSDDAYPVPKKLIGDKRVRTRYMPSFVPKDAKKTTERRDVKTTADAEGTNRGAGDDGANVLWKQRRKIRRCFSQEEEKEEEEEKKRKKTKTRSNTKRRRPVVCRRT